MKKLFCTLFIALFCAVSHAQVNTKIAQLFDRLSESDGKVHVHKIGGQKRPIRLEYYKNFFDNSDAHPSLGDPVVDSLQREMKKTTLKKIADVRNTIDELQEEAVETYRYEHQGNGNDTIFYSMNLCRDTARVRKYPTNYPKVPLPCFDSDENLYFWYLRHLDRAYHGLLVYRVALPQPDSLDATYTKETLTADIQRLFKQYHIKPRKALWQHDKAYSDTVWRDNGDHNYAVRTQTNKCLEGVTDATIYTVPRDQELLLREIHEKLYNLALNYTNIQNELYYDFNYNATFNGSSYWDYMLRTYDINSTPTSSDYKIGISQDDFGFHYVIAQTKGTLWVPNDWPSLKSIINDKKTYFKGMEPSNESSGLLNLLKKDK